MRPSGKYLTMQTCSGMMIPQYTSRTISGFNTTAASHVMDKEYSKCQQ